MYSVNSNNLGKPCVHRSKTSSLYLHHNKGFTTLPDLAFSSTHGNLTVTYIPRVGILIGNRAFDLSILYSRSEVNQNMREFNSPFSSS